MLISTVEKSRSHIYSELSPGCETDVAPSCNFYGRRCAITQCLSPQFLSHFALMANVNCWPMLITPSPVHSILSFRLESMKHFTERRWVTKYKQRPLSLSNKMNVSKAFCSLLSRLISPTYLFSQFLTSHTSILKSS